MASIKKHLIYAKTVMILRGPKNLKARTLSTHTQPRGYLHSPQSAAQSIKNLMGNLFSIPSIAATVIRDCYGSRLHLAHISSSCPGTVQFSGGESGASWYRLTPSLSGSDGASVQLIVESLRRRTVPSRTHFHFLLSYVTPYLPPLPSARRLLLGLHGVA
ncbi:hypothetical protein J6590_027320 [Homalodisca vitripennis]|nr:hypothetical protein J6590_027320 [Homalodisca vitripennis]